MPLNVEHNAFWVLKASVDVVDLNQESEQTHQYNNVKAQSDCVDRSIEHLVVVQNESVDSYVCERSSQDKCVKLDEVSGLTHLICKCVSSEIDHEVGNHHYDNSEDLGEVINDQDKEEGYLLCHLISSI